VKKKYTVREIWKAFNVEPGGAPSEPGFKRLIEFRCKKWFVGKVPRSGGHL
jgi:hypothetical protein